MVHDIMSSLATCCSELEGWAQSVYVCVYDLMTRAVCERPCTVLSFMGSSIDLQAFNIYCSVHVGSEVSGCPLVSKQLTNREPGMQQKQRFTFIIHLTFTQGYASDNSNCPKWSWQPIFAALAVSTLHQSHPYHSSSAVGCYRRGQWILEAAPSVQREVMVHKEKKISENIEIFAFGLSN